MASPNPGASSFTVAKFFLQKTSAITHCVYVTLLGLASLGDVGQLEVLIFFIFGLIRKSFGLLVFRFNLFDKFRLCIRSLSNIQTIQTHIQFLNLMVK